MSCRHVAPVVLIMLVLVSTFAPPHSFAQPPSPGASPVPGGSLHVALRLPTTIWLDSSTQPDNIGLSLEVQTPTATTLAVTMTLDAPLIGWGGAPFPQTGQLTVEPTAQARIYQVPGIAGVTVPADTPPGTRACATATWSSPLTVGVQTTQSCMVVVSRANPSGSPLPPSTPTTQPHAPACLVAAMYATSKQGARYSQGGYLPGDPIDPATGKPYSRIGPNSFDCSGLVWRAYHEAGLTVGWTTDTQITDGWAIPCTLADLEQRPARCWAPGDLIFGPGHVAMFVGSPDAPLFMDCYNHAVGCVLHDITTDRFYLRHRAALQARRIASGCEDMALDPGQPVPPPLPGEPARDDACVPDGPQWMDSGVGYSRGCGPAVLPPPPGADAGSGTPLRQFVGAVGWLGMTGRLFPPGPGGVHLHVGVSTGQMTDMCRWPNQLAGVPTDQPPPGGTTCTTAWADPLQFLPQAHADSLTLVNGTPAPALQGIAGDPTLSDAAMQLPPPGHPAGLTLPPADPNQPGGTWWSPGNDDRAQGAVCPLGGPSTLTWFRQLLAYLIPWLFGC